MPIRSSQGVSPEGSPLPTSYSAKIAHIEGWGVWKDSSEYYYIARLDDPHSTGMAWLSPERRFGNDDQARAFVVNQAASGSSWHQDICRFLGLIF